MTPGWDLALFELINRQATCVVMDVVGPALQPAWSAMVIGLLIAVPYLKKGGPSARWAVLAALLAVVAADLVCAHMLKPWVARPRPTVALEGVRMLVGRKGGFGFPSNHAANTMAMAVALSLYDRRWWLPTLALALLVGYSRVYVGVHYPLDVLGGWCVGIVTAVVAVLGTQSLAARRTRSAAQE